MLTTTTPTCKERPDAQGPPEREQSAQRPWDVEQRHLAVSGCAWPVMYADFDQRKPVAPGPGNHFRIYEEIVVRRQ
jgi:hypothetical protein